MSTRSLIGIENSDLSVTYIYCHYDGYPDYVGKILFDHYNTEEKIRGLLALGDLSSLGEEIGEKHPFGSMDEEYSKWCTAYKRDRGESKVDAKIVESKEIYLERDHGQCYSYLFSGGEWSVIYKYDDNKKLDKLEEVLGNI